MVSDYNFFFFGNYHFELIDGEVLSASFKSFYKTMEVNIMEPTKKKQFLPDIRLVKFEQRVDSFNHLLQIQILFGNRNAMQRTINRTLCKTATNIL